MACVSSVACGMSYWSLAAKALAIGTQACVGQGSWVSGLVVYTTNKLTGVRRRRRRRRRRRPCTGWAPPVSCRAKHRGRSGARAAAAERVEVLLRQVVFGVLPLVLLRTCTGRGRAEGTRHRALRIEEAGLQGERGAGGRRMPARTSTKEAHSSSENFEKSISASSPSALAWSRVCGGVRHMRMRGTARTASPRHARPAGWRRTRPTAPCGNGESRATNAPAAMHARTCFCISRSMASSPVGSKSASMSSPPPLPDDDLTRPNLNSRSSGNSSSGNCARRPHCYARAHAAQRRRRRRRRAPGPRHPAQTPRV
jgi:hypothetical protein